MCRSGRCTADKPRPGSRHPSLPSQRAKSRLNSFSETICLGALTSAVRPRANAGCWRRAAAKQASAGLRRKPALSVGQVAGVWVQLGMSVNSGKPRVFTHGRRRFTNISSFGVMPLGLSRLPICTNTKGAHGLRKLLTCPWHAWSYDDLRALLARPKSNGFGEAPDHSTGLQARPLVEKLSIVWLKVSPGGSSSIDRSIAIAQAIREPAACRRGPKRGFGNRRSCRMA